MSLARTALRLATVEALNADPTIAFLCQGRVFDSRLSELEAADPVPVIVVSTEEANGRGTSDNNGGPPFFDKCELVIEFSLRVTAPGEGGGVDVMLVETDREAESRLDLLEHRAVEAVTVADTPQSRLIRKHVTRRVTEYKSIRFSSDETALKLAVRMLHLTTELKGDDRFDATVAPTGPYAALPQPLRAVAEAMPPGSSGKATCDQLAALATGEPIVPFHGLDATVAPVVIDPASPPVPPTSAGAGYGNFGVSASPEPL